MIVRPAANRNLYRTINESGPDIFALECLMHPDQQRILLNLSSFGVEVCDAELRSLTILPCHSDRITAMAFSPQSSDCFYTSSADFTAKCWDIRCGTTPMASLRFDSDVFALAINQADNLLVVGVENNIKFYDRRVLSENSTRKGYLGTYADVHSNEITQLSFHPAHPNILASSAEDGLICLYNVGATEASEAAISILNTDCSVNKFGFFGPNGDGLYAISSVETLTVWHHPSAQRLAIFDSIREQTGVEYLIDCFETSPEEELILFAGNHNGHMSLLSVEPSSYGNTGTCLAGHQSTVRSVFPVKYNHNGHSKLGLLSTGEDGSLQKYSNILVDHSDPNQAVPTSLGKRRAEGETEGGKGKRFMSSDV